MKSFLLAALTPALLLTSSVAWAATTIEGTAHDAAGKPLGKAQLKLQNSQGNIIATTTTDTNGHFSITNIEAGSYVILATQNDAVMGSTSASVENTPVHKDLNLQASQAMNVVIGAQGKQDFRNNISPRTGTNAYKIDSKSIETLPESSNASFDRVLEQAPGVAQDSFGQVHVRGEHADLQYRLNGILLPEGISGFGQTIDPRLIESATLLDGALPAQYGFRTAGVVDIQTKNGFGNTGQATMYGGSKGTLEPSISYGGTTGNADYFVVASHLSSDLGIEAPTSNHTVLHDHTEQNKQFGYASYTINDLQRVEVIVGNSLSYFEIPNSSNQTSHFTLNGISTFNSADLNERQFESNQYGSIAWQGQSDDTSLQIAPYIRSSETHFRPDPIGDLVFNGVASDVLRKDLATGVQTDGSWRADNAHTLRMGFQIQNEHVTTDDVSQTFALDGGGNPLTTPETIVDNSKKDGQLYGFYLQDEWKLTDALTVNYGARFDAMQAYVSENQFSPRLGLVYKLTDSTTLHAGYARYFTPPPLELINAATIGKFDGTTNQSPSAGNGPVKAERSNNVDAGIEQKVGKEWQFGADAYYKKVRDLLDEGQFGQALIFTPFNYEKGKIYGIEFTGNYTGKDMHAYANFAISRALGQNIVSGQFNFGADELTYINNHYVHLDHDQTYTASGGISYTVREGTSLDLDGILGSGLRSGFANTDHLPWYTQFDAGIEQDLNLFPHDKTTARFTVINIFDAAYELRDGSGIGVGAPQWGPRRGFFAGLTQNF
jgi:outer membrane receptor protein involved in Fe transport